jgi:transcriptional regulator with XRE-family HTH domain
VRSSVHDVLPARVRRSLAAFGADLAIARRKRRLTVAMMAERLGVSKSTWLRVEKGDPSVSMGAYAMALFALGLGEPLRDLVEPRRDAQGLLLESERLPKRVRVKKTPSSS